ncbi:MAG TPA: glycosyltransferase [Oscillatoriales cyanobacterium M59_W2019_021]|nr:MAG: methyltransferase domain-containing protein [Cyanobacteria bacterium J055]HIK33437.1 glycosyltransferase [Oscillatoriales cyanobacterium M4454_W2019_049]HIK49988.1 glycosyltransferase [Oscillatoriales cyanobacterium M59_W2019_021]
MSPSWERLLEAIPADARSIVEFGCGKGELARRHQSINPHCTYLGVEADWEAAREAARFCDRVWVGKADSIDDRLFGEVWGNIDCIIYNGVLAFLDDPASLLKRHAAGLKSEGVAIADLPNFQYWQVLQGLFRGNWEDEATDNPLWGKCRQVLTFDRLPQLFENSGLQVFEIHPEGEATPAWQEFWQAIALLVKEWQLDAEKFARQTQVSRYIVRAIKSSQLPRKLLVQTLLISTIASDTVRVYQPDRLLKTIPGVRTLSQVQSADLRSARPDEAKVFIWQRDRWDLQNAIEKQRTLLRFGYLTIAEIDDDPRFWKEHLEHDFIVFRSCHCIQTSTEPLADFLRQFNPHVKIFPNQVLALPDQRVYDDEAPATLFFGAINREADWKPLMEVINRVLEEFGDRVRATIIYDRRFYDALTTPHKTFEPLCDYDRYHEILHECDLSILPLNDTEFNRMKSDLKFIECAKHGVAVLASPTVYERSIIDGETGLLYRSLEDFEVKFKQLIDRASWRRKLAQNAYEWVKRNRLLCQHYRQRYHWYLEMYDRLPELTRDLRDRVPQIFQLN